MLIHYVKENILQMLKKDKFLFFLILFVQAASVIVILFSYGIFNHFNTKVDEVEGTSLDYKIRAEYVNNHQFYMSTDSVKQFMYEVLPQIEIKLESYYIVGDLAENDYFYSFHCGETYYNGKYAISKYIHNYIIPKVGIDGRYMTEEEINIGERVFYLPVKDLSENTPTEVELGGEIYRRVGRFESIQGAKKYILIPMKAMPKDGEVMNVSLYFNLPLNKTEYEILAEATEKYFDLDEIKYSEFTGINNESSKRVYRSLIYVAVLLTIVSVVNYCLIYRYILAKRKKMFAISRICGCKRRQALAIYMVELVSVSIVNLIVFQLIYIKLILPVLIFKFEYMIYYYTADFYVKFNIIYIMALIVAYGILVVRMVNKTPNELIKEV